MEAVSALIVRDDRWVEFRTDCRGHRLYQERDRMDQRMGRWAEDTFQSMCTRARVTCNPSLRDDYGWDFLIEVASASSGDDGPADMRPAACSAFVQVKSTEGARRRTAMKVTNARELAKKAAPCFLVLFHRREGRERIYARLFDREDMKRTLEKARQTSIRGQAANRARVAFGFSDEEEHTGDLIDWMVNCVRNCGVGYGERKSQLAESIGYEGRNWRTVISFVGAHGPEDFVDLQLGLRDELEVENFRIFDERFGIENPTPSFEGLDGGTFRMQPEKERKCVVSLEAGDDVVAISSTMRVAAVPGVSGNVGRLAFRNEVFVLVVGKDKVRLTMHDAWSKELSLLDLEGLARLLSWHEQEIRVRVTGDVPEMNFGVRVTERSGRLDRSVLDAMGTLRRVAFRANAHKVRLSMEQVLCCLGELWLYHGVLSDVQMAWECQHPIPGDPPCDHEVLRNVIGMFDVEVGAYTFLAVFDAGIVQVGAEKQGNLRIDLGRRNLRDCLVGNGREAVRERAQVVYDECADGYGDDWLAIGSLNELVERETCGQRA